MGPILALRALGIADLATAIPALRGLYRAFPDEELVLAAPGWLAPLVGLIGDVDRLLPTATLHDSLDCGRSPRLAVNLHGRGPRSHGLLSGCRPKRLWAFACPEVGFTDGPPWWPHEHEVSRWCRLLRWYGVSADPDDLGLRRPPPGDRPTDATVLHIGAKAPDRRWPIAYFAEVARNLAACGHRVVVTGSPAERTIAEQAASGAGLDPDAVLAGRADVGDLAAVVAHARLVVSGDTGAAHLATAYRTPSVVLFGPVPPWRWGPPPNRPWHRVLWPGHDPESIVAGPGHPVLAAIRPADVLAAVEEVDPAYV